jgi:hypothetical protein
VREKKLSIKSSLPLVVIFNLRLLQPQFALLLFFNVTTFFRIFSLFLAPSESPLLDDFQADFIRGLDTFFLPKDLKVRPSVFLEDLLDRLEQMLLVIDSGKIRGGRSGRWGWRD